MFIKNKGLGKNWLQGILVKRTGPVSFLVKTLDGMERRCHQDQIRSRATQEVTEEGEENHFYGNEIPVDWSASSAATNDATRTTDSSEITLATPNQEPIEASSTTPPQEPTSSSSSQPLAKKSYPLRIRRQPQRLIPGQD